MMLNPQNGGNELNVKCPNCGCQYKFELPTKETIDKFDELPDEIKKHIDTDHKSKTHLPDGAMTICKDCGYPIIMKDGTWTIMGTEQLYELPKPLQKMIAKVMAKNMAKKFNKEKKETEGIGPLDSDDMTKVKELITELDGLMDGDGEDEEEAMPDVNPDRFYHRDESNPACKKGAITLYYSENEYRHFFVRKGNRKKTIALLGAMVGILRAIKSNVNAKTSPYN